MNLHVYKAAIKTAMAIKQEEPTSEAHMATL